MADVFLNLIDPLEARYRWDKTPEQIAIAKRDMADAFKQHAIEDLKAALTYIVVHRKFSTMPTVGDITDVIGRIISERKEAEIKPKARAGVATSVEAFLEGLALERESAKAWARDWLRKSPLGQESIRDGWCRALHEMIWQIRLSRQRANKPCEFDDIKIDDIATQTVRGYNLIDYFRHHNRALDPKLEAAVVLKEAWPNRVLTGRAA